MAGRALPNNRHGSGSHDERADPRPDDCGFFHFDTADVVLALEVDPKLRLDVEEETQGKGGLGADGALAFDDLVDGGAGNASAFGKLHLREVEAVEKLSLEDVSRSGGEDGFLFAVHGMWELVVVCDFDVERVSRFPAEAETPLVIDSDAVLSRAVAFESFQSVTRRNAQRGQ